MEQNAKSGRPTLIKVIAKHVAATSLMLATFASLAHELAPDTLLKSITEQVISLLKQNRGHLNAARTGETNRLVEQKALPLFDFGRMTQIAMGRDWGSATPAQRRALTTEFQALLVRTYSTALRSYRDEQIEFKPLDVPATAVEATVKTIVKQSSRTLVTIDYDMQKTPAGWKVYEIRMDGINLISNYHGTFAAKVRSIGIDGLIEALAAKNRQSNYSGSEPARTAPSDNPA
jgi:phospholipid transport system substrate-binding protein